MEPHGAEKLHLTTDFARRQPLAVVFVQALACLWIAQRFEETAPHSDYATGRCGAAFRLTLRTALKAFTTRRIAMVLLGGLLIDSVARNFANLNSEYYRMIGVPVWAFGFIGSLIAVGNWFIPSIAGRVNRRLPPTASLALGGVASAAALFLLVPAWPWALLVFIAVSLRK